MGSQRSTHVPRVAPPLAPLTAPRPRRQSRREPCQTPRTPIAGRLYTMHQGPVKTIEPRSGSLADGQRTPMKASLVSRLSGSGDPPAARLTPGRWRQRGWLTPFLKRPGRLSSRPSEIRWAPASSRPVGPLPDPSGVESRQSPALVGSGSRVSGIVSERVWQGSVGTSHATRQCRRSLPELSVAPRRRYLTAVTSLPGPGTAQVEAGSPVTGREVSRPHVIRTGRNGCSG